jgi:hypothetical protein
MLKRVIAALALWAALGAAHATSVLPLYLDEIIDSAAVAFEGVCVDNKTGRDPQTGALVTLTTFQVSDVLKGSITGLTYTMKQMGGEDKSTGQVLKMHGTPTFTPGQGYVVFLYGVSKQGFSSPVGLQQGRFEILQDANDAVSVSNGIDFRDMTQRMPLAQLPEVLKQKAGGAVTHVDLAQFKQMVRGHLGSVR